jgi:hypothetical protein
MMVEPNETASKALIAIFDNAMVLGLEFLKDDGKPLPTSTEEMAKLILKTLYEAPRQLLAPTLAQVTALKYQVTQREKLRQEEHNV